MDDSLVNSLISKCIEIGMSSNNQRSMIDMIEKWAHQIGVNLDRDPEQV